MFSKVKTFINLPASHKLIFIKFLMLVPLIELGIKTLKFKRTFRILDLFTTATNENLENARAIVIRHTNFLNLYQKQLPFLGNCLARSLCLWFLLARKGIETELKFGMKKENGQLLAHSWIEHDSIALLTEAELNENYTSFTESILTKVTK